MIIKHKFSQSLTASATLFSATFIGVASTFAQPVLAPHRAVYDVKLVEASDRSGVTSMNGRIVYEFQGSICDGYTTSFRFVTNIGVRGDSRTTDQRTTTFEEADGSLFRFVTRTFVNDRLDRELSGTATRDDAGVSVSIVEPDKKELELHVAMFPSQHMLDLLSRAENGENFYEQEIFDGSNDADQTLTTTVVIGPEKTDTDQADLLGDLANQSWRNVSISYFEKIEVGQGEGLPEYAIGFKMYDNGITRGLTMDYGDFTLEGVLTDLEILETESCE